jgi:hypothetical protein
VIASLRIAITMARRCEEPSATIFERYRDRKKPQEVVAAFHALGARSLADLHCGQVKWKAEQAEGLREYFRHKGTADPDKVSTDWPVQRIGEDEPGEAVSTVQ